MKEEDVEEHLEDFSRPNKIRFWRNRYYYSIRSAESKQKRLDKLKEDNKKLKRIIKNYEAFMESTKKRIDNYSNTMLDFEIEEIKNGKD